MTEVTFVMTVPISLKEVDRDFANRAKSAAYGRGLTLKQFILAAIEKALPDDLDERVARVEKKSKSARGKA